MRKKVILLGLNEINFEFVKSYCEQGYLPNFKKYIDRGWVETKSETEYKYFEPWIQWLTIYTGKTYAEHQVFRLGDIVDRKDLRQIFETLEGNNLTVGAVSPFNADNRLKNSPFFIPDPWTKTAVSGTKLMKDLSKAVQQSVNDNAQSKMTLKSAFSIIRALFAYVQFKRLPVYLSLMNNLRKPGVRAMVLDNLLADLFISKWKKHRPDFSNLFLNSGAHIQHHYLFNSKLYKGAFKNPEWYCPETYDPVLLALEHYDRILALLENTNTTIYIATGLHQRPHEHLTYYWRLNNHIAFLESIGLKNYTQVEPRMSRDFLIQCANPQDAVDACKLLESFTMEKDGERIFDVDNRGTSLFIELIYPNDLDESMAISNGSITTNGFKNFVSFVAIKNGEHDGTGYLLSNNGLKSGESIPLTAVYDIIKETCLNVEYHPVV